MGDAMERYACELCSYIYDPRQGDRLQGIAPGTPFAALPDDWRCPWCGVDRTQFVSEAEQRRQLEKSDQ